MIFPGPWSREPDSWVSCVPSVLAQSKACRFIGSHLDYYTIWLIFILTDHIRLSKLIFFNFENYVFQTSGLDVDQETILEVAVVVTNSLLNVLAESPNFVLKAEDKLLTDMKQPYKDQHTKVGLFFYCL